MTTSSDVDDTCLTPSSHERANDVLIHRMRHLTKEEIHKHGVGCSLADDIVELRALVLVNSENIKVLVDLAKSFEGAMTFFALVERTAMFIGKVAATVAILWATWKFLVKEAIAAALKAIK